MSNSRLSELSSSPKIELSHAKTRGDKRWVKKKTHQQNAGYYLGYPELNYSILSAYQIGTLCPLLRDKCPVVTSVRHPNWSGSDVTYRGRLD